MPTKRAPKVKKTNPRASGGSQVRVTYRDMAKKPDERGIGKRKLIPRPINRTPKPATKAQRLMPIPGCNRRDKADGAS